MSNSKTGVITTLSNSGAITGGGADPSAGNAAGGAGVSNFGAIETLTNIGGMINGGKIVSFGVSAAAGGAGAANFGTITTLNNRARSTAAPQAPPRPAARPAAPGCPTGPGRQSAI